MDKKSPSSPPPCTVLICICTLVVIAVSIYVAQNDAETRSGSANEHVAIELAQNLTVTVFKNGGNQTLASPSLKDTIDTGDPSCISTLRQKAFQALYPGSPTGTLWTGTGHILHQASQLTEGMLLYAVKPNDLFVWPGVYRGHKVQLNALHGNSEPLQLITLSISPRLFVVENFLTTLETDELVTIAAKTNPFNSKVQGSGGEEHYSEVRTSSQTWLRHSHGDVVEAVDRRVAELVRIDWEYFLQIHEDMQVVSYGAMQHYHCHYDHFDEDLHHNKPFVLNGTNRLATVYFYLQPPAAGGETSFCKGDPSFSLGEDDIATEMHFDDKQPALDFNGPADHGNCPGMRVGPRKGRAILWYNIDMEEQHKGFNDELSMHAGCDVLQGQKVGANKWIHNKPGDVRYTGDGFEDNKWFVVKDRDTGMDYYWNPITETTQWEKPKGEGITIERMKV